MNNIIMPKLVHIILITGILLIRPFVSSAAVQTEIVCIQCHGSQSGRLAEPVKLWRESIHAENGISCNNCHGGDPKDVANAMNPARGFLGKPKEIDIPKFCGRCHIGVLEDYLSSPHGKSLGKNGPTCVTCHGNHLVKKANIDLINEKNCTRCHDYKRAIEIRKTMEETEARIVGIERKIADLKAKGIDTGQMEKALFAIRNRFHRLFHELGVDKLKGETAAIDKELDKITLIFKQIDEEDQKRKLAGVAAITGAMLAALILRLYLKSIPDSE